MSKKMYEEANIRSIANKIREKTGTETRYKTKEMPSGINEVYDAGVNFGKKSGYDSFWDNFQNNGNFRIYYYAFAYQRFDDDNYNPKYPINCSASNTAAQHLFSASSGITDTKVPIIINSTNANAMFYSASGIVTIREIQIKKANTTFNSAFNGCQELANVTFTGLPIDNNLSLHDSPKLSDKSIDNIVSMLKDLTGGSSKKLTVHSDVYNRMVADGRNALVESKNWVLEKS